MAIGNVIVELRAERNLSQKKLAEAMGVSQSTIAQIEVNRNEATASTIRKLVDFFQVSADFLLELEDDFGIKKTDKGNTLPAYSKEEQQLVEDYRKLSSYKKDLIKNNIKAMLPATTESQHKKKID